MSINKEFDRISKLTPKEIGPTEENIKQKIIVPLLQALSHNRDNLEFEYRTKRGGKIDVYIKKDIPQDCKVIIDTKSYNENLNACVEQIKTYTFDEGALLAVLANGNEIRIYSPLRGVEFEKSLLYSFQRKDFCKESVYEILSSLLSNDNLQKKYVHKIIEQREKEIKNAMMNEETISQEYNDRIEDIDSDIERKEYEIEQLKKESEELEKELNEKITDVWNSLGLDISMFGVQTISTPAKKTTLKQFTDNIKKARRVTLAELVSAGLIKDGQTLFFYHTKLFSDEKAEILSSQNKFKYKKDGIIYSISDLAKNLLIKHGFKQDEHGVAGPKYWKTEDGKLLDELNEIVRKQRGDRK
jgi:cell division protein FtsL